MKRVGLWILLIAGGIFSVELTLSILRTRSVDAAIRIEGTAPVEVAPTGESGGAAIPESGQAPALALAPDGSVLVDLTWTYRIGPRFPMTTLRAEAVDEGGQVVAAQTHTLDCGSNTLDCSGSTMLRLRYGVTTEAGNAVPWPVGTYSIQVTRTDAGFKATPVLTRPVVVAASQ